MTLTLQPDLIHIYPFKLSVSSKSSTPVITVRTALDTFLHVYDTDLADFVIIDESVDVIPVLE